MRERGPNEREGGASATLVESPPDPGKMASTADTDEEFSTARSLLKYAGTWVGDDADELLELVYATRSEARF